MITRLQASLYLLAESVFGQRVVLFVTETLAFARHLRARFRRLLTMMASISLLKCLSESLRGVYEYFRVLGMSSVRIDYRQVSLLTRDAPRRMQPCTISHLTMSAFTHMCMYA